MSLLAMTRKGGVGEPLSLTPARFIESLSKENTLILPWMPGRVGVIHETMKKIG
jgi:hypothetical protein